MAILALLCLAFGVLPTYVIPMLDPAPMQLAAASASDALVPPFFASLPRTTLAIRVCGGVP